MGEIKCVYCGSDISGIGVHCHKCGEYADKVRSSYTASTVRKIVAKKIKRYWLHLLLVIGFIILYYLLPFSILCRPIIATSQAIIQVVITVLLIFLAPKFKEDLAKYFSFLKYDD